eukprot:1841361-Rhodomonas_salina.3
MARFTVLTLPRFLVLGRSLRMLRPLRAASRLPVMRVSSQTVRPNTGSNAVANASVADPRTRHGRL